MEGYTTDVEEKMEDEEFLRRVGVSFDSLDSEKVIFIRIGYPMDSLGWDRDDLCGGIKTI